MADLLTANMARRAIDRVSALRRTPWQTWLAVIVLAVIVIGCLAAPLIAPYDPTEQSSQRFVAPSLTHLLGTDELGRDLFSRVLYGGQLTLFIGGGATAVAMVLATVWGMAAAFAGRMWDEVLMRLADAVMAIPQILFALVVVSALGADPVRLAVIIGILLTPTTARVVRSSTLSELQEDYYTAAVAYGATNSRLLFREVLPNVRNVLTVQATMNMANAVLLEAALSFVGIGIRPPQATWGTLVQQGYGQMYQSMGYVIFPALLIFITIWMLNLLDDQLETTGIAR